MSCLRLATYSVLVLATALGGCSAPAEKTVLRPTLAQLPPFVAKDLVKPDVITPAVLQQVYQELLALAPAQDVRQKVLYRLSQLNTQQVTLGELSPELEQQALATLISDYQYLLSEYPDDPNNELIRYQLARALDLTGNNLAAQQQMQLLLQQFPHSDFAAELGFRIGDIYYSQANYAAALSAFEQVLAIATPALKQHTLYMLGWSHFQLQQYPQADEAFLAALDMAQLAQDATEQQALAQELLRILSISLSYQQQADSLLALLKRLPYQDGPASKRPVVYQARLFQALADFLFEKELFQAALNSYQVFIAYLPQEIAAARMQLKLIQHHLDYADAPAAEQAQQRFIHLFGPASAFWQQAFLQEQTELAPKLAQYLDYFARQGQQQLAEATAEQQPLVYQQLVPQWQQLLQLQPLLTAEAKAALLLPDDVRFLLAEALAGSGQREAAFALYQQLGYGSSDLQAASFNAEQAAYRALLLSEALFNSTKQQAAAARWWQQQEDFVRVHSRHSAAQHIALNQLTALYQQQDFAQIDRYAKRVTEWPHPELSQAALVLEARFIVSQSAIAQADYALAEQTIEPLLSIYQTSSSAAGQQRYQLLQAQRASAIYQQAQQDNLGAALQLAHLQRLLALPTSEFHQSAAYQQIRLKLEQRAWAEAITLMQAYQARYPNSAEHAAINSALLSSYQQLADWQGAAELLTAQLDALPLGEAQQRLLYQAAAYYLRANNTEAARLAYRRYANNYPTPHLEAQEARAQLVALYQAQQDNSRRDVWYQRIINAEQQVAKQLPKASTERTRYLAANAALALGEIQQRQFSQIKLTQPLAQNLKKKQTHMSAAIEFLHTSMQWQVADFYSQAQFQVASLYQEMANALLASERPSGLDALALEQYELLLEEQAYPFEEQAIAIHQQNAALVSQAIYDKWVAASFSQLAALSPARYRKPASYLELADEAY